MQGLDCFEKIDRIRLKTGRTAPAANLLRAVTFRATPCAAPLLAVGLAMGAAMGAALHAPTSRATETDGQVLDLWTSKAPIASVLAFVVDEDTFELRVADDIDGYVSGRLRGSVSKVLEPLLDEHQMTVHHDGATVWFDRRDRDVVVTLSLDAENQPAFAAWVKRELETDADNGQGKVKRDDGELVVAGTRAFVQDTLGRIDAARSALGEVPTRDRPVAQEIIEIEASDASASAGERTVADIVDPDDIIVVPEDSLPDDPTVTVSDREFRSVSDVPGFDTDYR